jgi:hypothetical protein
MLRYEIRIERGHITIYDRRKRMSYWMEKPEHVEKVVELLNEKPDKDAEKGETP